MSLLDIPPSAFLPNALVKFDYHLFHKINSDWQNPVFDYIFPFIREPTLWVPFYFFLIVFVIINFKKRGLYWIFFFAINAMLSDFVSSRLIKGNFPRLRPCRDPLLSDSIRFLVEYCPISSSFTSSHAANHFSAAMFIFMTFRKSINPWWGLVLVWAFAISYAQVYVGVHFPIDIICGAIVGALLGYIVSSFYNKKIGLIPT